MAAPQRLCSRQPRGARTRAGFAHFRHAIVYNVRIPTRSGDPRRRAKSPHRRTSRLRHVLSRRAAAWTSPARSLFAADTPHAEAALCGDSPVRVACRIRPGPPNFLARRADISVRGTGTRLHRRPSDDLSPFRAWRTPGRRRSRRSEIAARGSPPSSSAMIPARPTWPPRSEFQSVVIFGHSDRGRSGRRGEPRRSVSVGRAGSEASAMAPGHRRGGPAAGARMNGAAAAASLRPPLLVLLALSVVLMAVAGAAHGLMALLVGPIFDRVLEPWRNRDRGAAALLGSPSSTRTVYLDQTRSRLGFTMSGPWWRSPSCVVFLVKGILRLLRQLPVNYAGFSAVTDLRNAVFDKVLRQGAQFFEAHSTGRLMSSIMNDIEKIQVATSHILADLLRQIFTVLGLLVVVLQQRLEAGAGQPDRAARSCWSRPLRIGRRIRRTSRRTQDQRRSSTRFCRRPSAATGGEGVRRRGVRIAPLPRRGATGCCAATCATCCSRRSPRR